LSLAEGEGRNALFLARRGFDVLAVDSSSVGLEKATKLAEEHGESISTQQADLAEFQIEKESWDAVVSVFCHVPRAVRAELHRKVVAGLKPGGVLILEAYTPKQLEHGTGGPQDAALTMQLDDLKKELEGLELVHALETEREVIEGKYHNGHAAVVQVIAVKPD
jgi:SAM-dependent methyltransferase